MDAARAALAEENASLKAELSVARAKASEDLALIAQQKLRIAHQIQRHVLTAALQITKHALDGSLDQPARPHGLRQGVEQRSLGREVLAEVAEESHEVPVLTKLITQEDSHYNGPFPRSRLVWVFGRRCAGGDRCWRALKH